jgi:hypothetical protein
MFFFPTDARSPRKYTHAAMHTLSNSWTDKLKVNEIIIGVSMARALASSLTDH